MDKKDLEILRLNGIIEILKNESTKEKDSMPRAFSISERSIRNHFEKPIDIRIN